VREWVYAVYRWIGGKVYRNRLDAAYDPFPTALHYELVFGCSIGK
jgi:hypothetical protein